MFQLGRWLGHECGFVHLGRWPRVVAIDVTRRRCLGNEMRRLRCGLVDSWCCWCWHLLSLRRYRDKTSPCQLWSSSLIKHAKKWAWLFFVFLSSPRKIFDVSCEIDRLKCCNTINNLKGVCFCAIWPCIYVIVLPSSSVKHCLTSQECCERATRALRALSVNQYAALSPPHDVASADSLCTSTLFLFTIVVDPALITLHRFN